MLKITVGSTSKHKIGAMIKACHRLGVEAEVNGHKTTSKVNEQPVGFNETMKGALARAMQTHNYYPLHMCIGIESGILRSEDIAIDFAVIVLIKPNGEKLFGTTSGIMFPKEDVAMAETLGFETTTVGSIIAKRIGGDGTDPHSMLTKGKITREKILINGICIILDRII